MTVSHVIKDFPSFKISAQVFYVPGAAVDGGFTRGGARITSPEPGGYSMLEIQPALQVNEFSFPTTSWLMSQGNGQIFRVRLAPTPQIAASRRNVPSVPWAAEGLYPSAPWSNQREWSGDLVAVYSKSALEGSNVVTIDMRYIGQILQLGHVIGHKETSYLVDAIEYDDEGYAKVTVNPSLRNAVAVGDSVWFRPWFVGQIINGNEIRTMYEAINNGHIQMQKIVLAEVIV